MFSLLTKNFFHRKIIKIPATFYKFMSDQIEERINSIEDRTWGELPMVQSNTNYNLSYVELENIKDLANETKVIVRARVQNIRAKGNMAFLVLRDKYDTA